MELISDRAWTRICAFSPSYQPLLAQKFIDALAILIKMKIYFTEKKKARAPNYCQSENKIRQHNNQIQ